MTKDVLVSISGKHIDIMDDPARGYEVGEDGIEVVTPLNLISTPSSTSLYTAFSETAV